MTRFLSMLAVAASVLFAAAPDCHADAGSKIKALIITGDDIKTHPWKETTAALKKLLLESGKFEVTVSEDYKPLDSADELKAYDVIVLNRYTAKSPLSDTAKKNFLEFVSDGKGLYVEHFASTSSVDWPEFGKLCGRHWVMGKSGHGPRGPFEAKITAEENPITAGMKDFHTDDELYAKLEGKEPIHVLVEAHSDWSKKTEPLVFWQPYGKGRVVYCTLGHDVKAVNVPEVSTLIVRSVEYAATAVTKCCCVLYVVAKPAIAHKTNNPV